MSAMVRVTGRFTRPDICMVWWSQDSWGTGPWLRTKCSWFGVTKPAFSSAFSGASVEWVSDMPARAVGGCADRR